MLYKLGFETRLQFCFNWACYSKWFKPKFHKTCWWSNVHWNYIIFHGWSKNKLEVLWTLNRWLRSTFWFSIARCGRPFQERRAMARTRAHTRVKVFRRVVNRMRKWNLTTRFYYIITCVWSSMWLYYSRIKQCFFSSTFLDFRWC